jgi:hypothetical protein
MLKRIGSIKSEIKDFKSISIWDQFYKVALNTIGPLLVFSNGNQYILIGIDHYSKWVEIRVHDNTFWVLRLTFMTMY